MLRTPAGRRRMDILEWLKDPVAHFPDQGPGDPVEDGVTADAIAVKLNVSREAAETHLGLLVNIGLLRTKRIGPYVHYRRDEMRIAEVARMFEKGW
ncbi:ArsR/SmtB family transcription factor [Streptomyces lanatus]|uniref:Helix-turn-helix domain-containing protein n=1 Tax=Streptomyces lanatus TaxID=66900 RepID=A0ABV1Y7D3_9ACTN|nr:helix-turn-helix domain-containing protein [Streptomyces lanatus]GHH10402.1 hypothetical protein GCM10018780_47290 [Streptomyces lanatus]